MNGQIPERRMLGLAVRIAWLSLGLLAAGDSVGVGSAATVTSETVLALARVADPQVSPSGSHVAFVVTRLDEDARTRSHVWLVASDGGTPVLLSHGPGNQATPRWSPESGFLAFVDRTPEGDRQVQLYSMADGRMITIPGAAGAVDLAFSPDGRYLALRKLDPVPPAEAARLARGEDHRIVGEAQRHTGLWVLEVSSGRARRVSRPGRTVWSFSWSPTGDAIAALVSQDPRAEGLEYGSSLVLIAVADGAERTLATRTCPHAVPSFSPDGAWLAFLAPPAGFIERGVIHLVRREGGEAVPLLGDEDFNVWDVRWHPRDGTLVAGIQRGTTHTIATVGRDGSVRELVRPDLALTPYWSDCYSLSGDGSRLAYLSEQGGIDADLWTSAGEGRDIRRVSSFNAPPRQLALGAARAIRWRSSQDGATVEGILVHPPGWSGGASLPLVVVLHGGPAYGWGVASHVRSLAQLLAAEGYLVLMPNFRGSAGYGMAWMSANVGDFAAGPWSDVTSGVEHLVRLGLADPERLFLNGGSYGGYLTFWGLAQAGMFKAAFVRAGITELASQFATTDEPSYWLGYFGANPYERPEEYRAASPLTYAERIRTPLAIVHGENDLRVPLSQGLQLHAALVHHGVPVEMVVYPREGHGIREAAHQRDMMARMLAWFQRWDSAKPQEEPQP